MVIDMNYWRKVIKRIFIFFLTIIGVWLGFKLSVFYMPFLIAFIISLLLEPIIKVLMRKTKLKRKTSAIIVFILAFSIIIGLLTWGIATLISEISNILGNIKEKVSNFFGGGKASGGPVKKGTSYLVGENGPELFTPDSNGNIIPNGTNKNLTILKSHHPSTCIKYSIISFFLRKLSLRHLLIREQCKIELSILCR